MLLQSLSALGRSVRARGRLSRGGPASTSGTLLVLVLDQGTEQAYEYDYQHGEGP